MCIERIAFYCVSPSLFIHFTAFHAALRRRVPDDANVFIQRRTVDDGVQSLLLKFDVLNDAVQRVLQCGRPCHVPAIGARVSDAGAGTDTVNDTQRNFVHSAD